MNRHQRTIIGFLILFLIGYSVFSQDQGSNSSSIHFNLQDMASAGGMFKSFDNRFKGVKGSIMLFENYLPGKIFMSKGQIVSTDQINYDAYQDELLVMRSNREMVVSNDLVKSFTIIANEDSLHFTRVMDANGKFGFFQKMSDGGEIQFYKKIFKTLLEPNYQGAYSSGRDYSEFILEQKLLYLEKGKPLQEFKNRKTFLQAFPEYEDQLQPFIKDQKIDFKNDEDLKKLFIYFNRIKK